MTVEMELYASTVIWLTSFLVPYLLFIVNNHFRSFLITMFRAVTAIGFGWLYIIAYAISANAMSVALLSSHNKANSTIEGDGAALSFSVIFGWVTPTLVVCIAWFLHNWLIPIWKSKK